jgi:4-hydroxy-tetrahydrodipicolinate reductase
VQGVRTVIVGISGRMGRTLVRTAREFPEIIVTGALASPGSASLGRDAGELAGAGPLGVAVTCDPAAALAGAEVVVDFSQPQATGPLLGACRSARKPLLIGTTAFDAELPETELVAAAREIPLLVASNTSLGVALLGELVRIAARALPADFDIEILEAHHRTKRDAPSGTALSLARAAAAGRGLPAEEATAGAGRPRSGTRRQGEIGFAVVRGGDLVGEHTVLLAGPGEQLTLGHRSSDRAIFARGALRAALWLAGRPPGRYEMRDVLLENHPLT